MSNVRRPSLNAISLAAAATLVAAVSLSGCAVATLATGSAPIPVQTSSATLTGRVMGGQQPIGGATVKLYQTGNTGYGAGAKLLDSQLTTSLADHTTAGQFSFTIPAAACPSSSSGYAPSYYAVATGGDATGNTRSNLNSNITLVSVFDTCATGTPTSIAVNELTTVAAAYALRSFTTDSNGTVSIGAPATNQQGFNDALANTNLLVNGATGKANASSATTILPTYTINTLGDILAYCVNSGATGSASCTNLFTATTAPGSTTAPADTFQATLNIAQYPGSNVATLLGYVGGTAAPYTPTIASASATSVINDLSLGIGFVNNTLNNASQAPDGLAIDAKDNVFAIGAYTTTSGSTAAYIGEVTSASAGAVETATQLPGTVATPQQGAFDLNNNLWITDSSNAAVIELPKESVSGATVYLLTSPDGNAPGDTGKANTTSDIAQNTWGLAIDGSNNVFTNSYRSQTNCASTGTTANTLCQTEELPSGSSTFAATFNGLTAYTSSNRGMAADANPNSPYQGNIWSADYGDGYVHILNPSTGANVAVSLGSGTASNYSIGLALDANSNAWVSGYGPNNLYQIPASDITGPATQSTTTTATAASPAGIASTSSAPATGNGGKTAYAVGGLHLPRYTAIDGAGNVWVGNGGSTAIVEYSPGFATTGAYLSPYYGFSPSLSQTTLSIGFFAVTKACVATLTTAHNLTAGQSVTLSGFTSAAGTFLNGQTVTVTAATHTYNFTATVTGCNTTTAVPTTPDTGVGTVATPNPALFTCTTSGAVNTCTIPGNFSSTYAVAIDRAGSVWSLASNGVALELLGPGTPVNPVLAAGQYGVEP